MLFNEIEKLKKDYTDKYVVVDGQVPELQRFDGMTGVVKTVNMNGRALVEFDQHENIGWFDIELDFLKVVDKPVEVEKKPAAKPAPAKAAKPAAKQEESKPAAGGGMSVSDILAAARGGSSAPAKEEAPKAEAPKKEEKAAADPAGMSVADILAAARGESAAPAAEPAVEEAPEEAPPAAEESPPAAEEAAPAAEEAEAAPAGDLPTDVDGIVAYCKKVDG